MWGLRSVSGEEEDMLQNSKHEQEITNSILVTNIFEDDT